LASDVGRQLLARQEQDGIGNIDGLGDLAEWSAATCPAVLLVFLKKKIFFFATDFQRPSN